MRPLIPTLLPTLLVVAACSVRAQTPLPACTGEDTAQWHNCQAKASFADGSRYEGSYKNGKKNGIGKYLLSNGDVYAGQMLNDAAEGFGIHVMKNGDRYTGQFKANNYNGQGIYLHANGAKREGLWRDDNLVRAQPVNLSELQRIAEAAEGAGDIEAQAKNGDPKAQLRWAQMLRKGEGVKRNDEEAAKLFRPLAEQGDAVAARELASMHWEGQGVPKDEAQTLKWARIAAEKGDPAGQRMLGLIYLFGRGVPKNEAEGIKWSRLAAQGGDSSAQMTVKAHDAQIDGEARWLRMQKMQFNMALLCIDKTGSGMDFNSARYLMDTASYNTQAFVSQVMASRECMQPKEIRQFRNIALLRNSVVVRETGRHLYLIYQDKKENMTYGLIGVAP